MKTMQELNKLAREGSMTKGAVRKALDKKFTPGVLSDGVNAVVGQAFDTPLILRPETDMELPNWRQWQAKAMVSGKESDAVETLRLMRERRPEIKAKIGELETESARLDPEAADHVNQIGLIRQLKTWVENSPDRLEAPGESLWYKLRDARKSGKFKIMDESRSVDTSLGLTKEFFAEEPQVFLVEHDWAKAFAGAADFAEGEYPLPFESCVFEFKVDGRRVLVPTHRHEDLGHVSIICFQCGDWWYAGEPGSLTVPPDAESAGLLLTLYTMIRDNIRAICIALDAEVAVTEVTRAPHRLNMAREKQGKSQINDFRTVNLAKRSRVEALPSGADEPRWKVRLHFRRGHWRHFQNHKTWIRWMLVGDPDLGFIDHHYRA